MALNIIINKVNVAASFAAGATVATAVASGGTTPYIYSLATGGDKFAINSSTGVVTTIEAMDITNIASFSVIATDSTIGTALTATSDVVYPNIQATIQNKFNSANKIYKITKDIDLGNGVLTIPARCTLDFQGGSFSNGIIKGNDTIIKCEPKVIFGENITILGNWNNENVYSDWFSFYKLEKDAYLNTVIINNLLKLSDNKLTTNVVISSSFPIYVKIIENGRGTFYIPSYTNLNINAVIQMTAVSIGQYYMFAIDNAINVTIRGGHLIGDVETHTGTSGEWGVGIYINKSKHINVYDIRCSKFWGDGILVDGEYESNSEFVVIENVECDYNRRQGITIDGCNNGRIVNAYLHHTGAIKFTAPGHGLDIETYIHSSTLKEHTVSNFIVDGITTHNNNYNGVSISVAVGTNTGNSKNIKLINSTISEGLNISGDTINIENCNFGGHIEFRLSKNIQIKNCNFGTRIIYYNTLENVIFDSCYFKAYGKVATMLDNNTDPNKSISAKFFNCYFEDIKTVSSSAEFQNINDANDVNFEFHKCTIVGNDTHSSLNINYGAFYDSYLTSHWNMQIQNKGTRQIKFMRCFLQAVGANDNVINFMDSTKGGNNIVVACDAYASNIVGNFTGYMNRVNTTN